MLGSGSLNMAKCKVCNKELVNDLERNSCVCDDCFFHGDCCGLEKL